MSNEESSSVHRVAGRFDRCVITLAVAAICLSLAARAFVTQPVKGGDKLPGPAVVHREPTAEDDRRSGEDWPRFLGPQEDGVSRETQLLETWPSGGPPLIWEKTVGTGYSAPSVRGNQLVLHHRIKNEDVIECMRADNGSTLWTFRYPSDFTDPFGYNNGPRCTPLVTEQYCYTFGANGTLCCVEMATGKQVWIRQTLKDFQVPDGFFGVGCTPILEGNLLITLVGGQPDSGVVAFDARTGKTVWQSVGKSTWNGVETDEPGGERYKWTGEEMVVSYSSPLAVTIHGRRHVLCLVRQGLVSLDPQTGAENFKYWFRSRSQESVNAARPVVVGDKIFISAAYRAGSALLQVARDGKSCAELWRNTRNMLTHWSTAIHVNGYLYGFSGRHEREGQLRCLELKTGKVVWASDGTEPVVGRVVFDQTTGGFQDRQTGKPVPFPFYGRGSKIQTGNSFIVLGERGTLAKVTISAQGLKEQARASYKQIHYPAWTAPVLSRKRLYLRCEDALICLDLAPVRPPKSGADR